MASSLTLIGLVGTLKTISRTFFSNAQQMKCQCFSKTHAETSLILQRNSNYIYKRSFAAKSGKRKSSIKKEVGEKPDLKTGLGVMYHELPILFVNANYNNTMFSITDHKGRVAAWTSAGVEGFKGAKRGTNYAGQMAAVSAAKKAKGLGIESLRVKIRGMGPGRQSSVKGLIAGGIDIVSITDVTPVPHNGCKPPKQRRI